MDHEILFEVWNTEQKKMHGPFSLPMLAGFLMGIYPNLGNEVYRQWSGLIDKNRKPIYERDVVRFYQCQNNKGEVWLYKPGYPAPESWIAEVKFRDGAFMLESIRHEGLLGKPWSVEDFTLYTGTKRDWEIIGNTLEHPELV